MGSTTHIATLLLALALLPNCGTSSDMVHDAAPDQRAPIEASTEASADTSTDAGVATSTDVGVDATARAETDATLDAQLDSPSGMSDAFDAPPDAEATETGDGGSCSDRRKNGDETDVDCGGSCPPCGPNKGCLHDADCSTTASGCDSDDSGQGGCTCDPTSMKCVYNHCFDHKIDDGETAMDCGGGKCPACTTGQGCVVNTDCSTNACDGVSFTCVNNPCIDHRRDGVEVDIDCGGANSCSRCVAGRNCAANSDCQVGHPCSGAPAYVCM